MCHCYRIVQEVNSASVTLGMCVCITSSGCEIIGYSHTVEKLCLLVAVITPPVLQHVEAMTKLERYLF